MTIFMFLFNFFVLSVQEVSRADIFAPIYVDADNKVNTWKLFGSAQATSENIIVVPKIKGRKGAMWTNVLLPKTNWSVAFDLTVVDPEEDFSYSIFYTKEASSDKSFHGGPSRFEGFALIGKFFRGKKGNVFFDLYFVQSDASIDLRTFPLEKPAMRFQVPETFSIGLQITMSGNMIYVEYDTGEKQDIIVQDKQLLSYNGYYLGVTAKNTGFASALVINEVHFVGDINNKEHSIEDIGRPEAPAPYTNIDQSSVTFKNAVFKEMSKQMILAQSAQFDPSTSGMFDTTDVNTVFTVIDEANRANYDVATFRDLSDNITNSIAIAVTKLTKRLNAATNSIQTVNKSFEENYQQAKTVINNFNASIHEVFAELLQNTFNATSELVNEFNDTTMELPETGQSLLTHLLYVVSFMEIFIILFVIVVKTKESDNNSNKLPF